VKPVKAVNIGTNAMQLIGRSPLVYLTKLNKTKCDIICKLEFYNPGGSVKDRIGVSMIKDLEQNNKINNNSTIICNTSGNTGIALAWVCASKNLKLIIVMPDSMSEERFKILQHYDVEIITTSGELGMKGSEEKAKELHKTIKNSILLDQFSNPANPEIHKRTTAVEIWNECNTKVDAFICGVGTGGTITGVGEYLKSKNPEIKVIAVEPKNSPVLSGGKPGKHKIQGIGAGFIPAILNTNIYDEIIQVSDEDAIITSKNLAKYEGISSGISGGAAVWASIKYAEKFENKKCSIITIIPDSIDK